MEPKLKDDIGKAMGSKDGPLMTSKRDLYEKAEAAFRRDNFLLAIQHLQNLLSMEEDHHARELLGECYQLSGNYDSAITECRLALDSWPTGTCSV